VIEANSNSAKDEEGWTLVTRRRPRNPKQPHPPPLCQRKRQGRRKTPRCAKSNKKSKASKRQEVQPIDLLEQKPLVPITLKEFFPVRFFEKITVNMTSCYELENEEDEKEAKLEKPPKNDGEALTSLEALPICDDWRQIFNLPKEIRQQIVAALQHLKLYVDKVKSAGQPTKDVAHYVACNTAITFTDDDLLLGSKPHNCPLFVTGYIREQKIRWILVDGGSAVNIMPKSTMNDLGITMEELSKS